MKQVLRNLREGYTVAEVPVSASRPGRILIQTANSLISAGTERDLVSFGRANIVQKARQQPERIKGLLDKVRSDGLLQTLETVHSQLDKPTNLGYCSVGTVVNVGEGVEGYAIGDRVAGTGPHAEFVSVAPNLCAKVPDDVPDAHAAFTALAAIALQGVRLVQPTLGETVLVIGLGLIGQLTVQLLRANGCRVIGVDPDRARSEMAREAGALTIPLSQGDPVTTVRAMAGGTGVDSVIITAGTRSSDPVSQAAQACRKRGRIVLVGVAGLDLNRSDFYEKELTFQVSCSFGPGRHDPNYEDKGTDYPIGFVRWTEQRNFEAVLELMASGRLDVKSLISHRFSIDDAARAYELLSSTKPSMGILLDYLGPAMASELDFADRSVVLAAPRPPVGGVPAVSVIGPGNFASSVLIPAMQEAGVRLKAVAGTSGAGVAHVGRKFGFEEATTETDTIAAGPDVDAIAIASRRESHGRYVLQAVEAGKHLFVEAPLCLTLAELTKIEGLYREKAVAGDPPLLMVGFHRRFAPHTQRIKTLLEGQSAPKAMIVTVNAGPPPLVSGMQDIDNAGGPIVGEACHFIDLLRYLAGAPISGCDRLSLADGTGASVTLQLAFADGSTGTIHYLANGHVAAPGERLDVFCGGTVLQLDNFRSLTGYGWPKFKSMNLRRPATGQKACVTAFIGALRTGAASPIPIEEVMDVARTAILLGQS